MKDNNMNAKKKSRLKLFGKVHVFDIIVLLLVLVLVVGFVNKISGGNLMSSISGQEEARVKVVVKTMGYPEEALQNIVIGDQLAENKQYMDGEIVDVEIIDMEVSMVNEDGEIVLGIDPTNKCALVTLEATAKYKEPVYSFGKQEFVSGSYIFLTTTTLNLKTIVISSTPME